MNEPNLELININQKLLDHITNVNIEERKFMTALTIFESLVGSVGVSGSSINGAYYGTLANCAIDIADIFVKKYIEKELNHKSDG